MPDSSVPINAPTTVGQSMASFLDAGGEEHEKVIVEWMDAGGQPIKTSAANPLPVAATINTTGLATEAKQDDEILALNSIAAEDFATQATLAALLAKVITAPSTEAKQDAMITLLTTIAAITQPLTDTQLRAAPVPISGTVAVTGGGDATAANQVTGNNSLASILAKIITAPSTEAKQDTIITALATLLTISDFDTKTGSLTETAPATDTASSGVNGRLQRIAQRLTSLITALGSPFQAGASIGNTSFIATQATATNLKAQVASTQKPSIGATTVMTVTNLQSLASSVSAGWQSARVSNLSTLATDYEIFVKLTTANTAPANDKAMYVWICPFYTTDAGTTWFASSQGTTTLPTGIEGTTTIATPHNLRLLGVLNYTTQQMVVQDTFLLSNCFGNRLPDGFSIIIINFSGAALSTGCVCDYSPLNDILI